MIVRPLHRVACQHQVERLALSMLRAQAPNQSELQQAFADLAGVAQERGMAIRAPEAPCLSADEILLLGYLAAWQRQNARVIMPTPAPLRTALMRCAKALDAQSCRLPYLTIQRAALAEEAGTTIKTVEWGQFVSLIDTGAQPVSRPLVRVRSGRRWRGKQSLLR